MGANVPILTPTFPGCLPGRVKDHSGLEGEYPVWEFCVRSPPPPDTHACTKTGRPSYRPTGRHTWLYKIVNETLRSYRSRSGIVNFCRIQSWDDFFSSRWSGGRNTITNHLQTSNWPQKIYKNIKRNHLQPCLHLYTITCLYYTWSPWEHIF
jgi:hypothetical protein